MKFLPTGTPAMPPGRRLIPVAAPLLTFLAYAALRWFLLGPIQAIWFSDTALYAAQYRQGFAGGLFGQGRPWGYPFFLWLTGYHWGLAIAAQRLVAALAWFALARAAAGLFRSDTARRIVFYGTLLVSLSLFVLSWDAMLLSESLSISLFVALTAAWFRYLGADETPRLRWLIFILALSVPLAALRDAHAPLLLFFVGVMGVEVGRRFLMRRHLGTNKTEAGGSGGIGIDYEHEHESKKGLRKSVRNLAGGCLVAAGLILCAAAHQHDAQVGERAWINIGNVLTGRAFSKEVGDDYFVADQDNIAWMARNYQLPAGEVLARGRRLLTQAPPPSPRYRAWLIERGSRAWTTFLLCHPAWVWSAYTGLDQYGPFPENYLSVEAQKWDSARLRLPYLIQHGLHGLLRALACGTSQLNAVLALATLALGAWWAWSWFRLPSPGSAQAGALFWLVASSSLAALIAIVGDYIETWRHAIVGLIALQAALPLGAAVVMEQIVEKKSSRREPEDKRTQRKTYKV